jgi:hypothetical protein
MVSFILAHWHCIIPLVAAIIVSAFLLRDKKQGSATDDEPQEQGFDDRCTTSEADADAEYET